MNREIRIGLVDDRLPLAHAPGFAYKLSERRNEPERLQGRIVACTARHAAEGAKWADENGIPYLPDAAAMKGLVDAIVIPASSTPESHPELLESALPLAVPIYVDKPFAPGLETAREMFARAKACGVPVMSASILRFSDEIVALRTASRAPDFIQTWGSDNERFDEFLIHPVEMALALAGEATPTHVRCKRVGRNYRIHLDFAGGQEAAIFFCPGAHAYEAALCDQHGWQHRTLSNDFWVPFLDRLLEGFSRCEAIVQEEQTLQVIATLDAIKKSRNDEIINIWNAQ